MTSIERTDREIELFELEMLKREEARVYFRCFLDYVTPSYDRQWFHTLIADKCQALIEGTLGKSGLMIFVPPQHGKSEIVSRKLPAWVLGKNPRCKIVGSSYSAYLAQQFSRSIQRTMDEENYSLLFPDTFLNSQNVSTDAKRGYLRNIDIFETVGYGGFYRAVGVCGGLTGTSVDLGIIDDPVKDAIEANSDTYRNRVWDWYLNVFLTRLHNQSKQLLIMTRWHEDDLAGRLLKTEPEKWEVVSIPAIREDFDDIYDRRDIGEALWEEKHSLQKLLNMKSRSGRVFSALYQQHPTIEGGNIVKREWFRTISMADFKTLRYNEPMRFYVDTGYNEKKSTDNDPTGILAACKIDVNIYLYDAQKVYKNMPDLLRFIPDYLYAHCYNDESVLAIEPKANGESVVQMFEQLTNINVKRTPVPHDSKDVRFKAVSPRIECGRVYLVEGSWNEEFMTEVCGFPTQPHDEYVDILGYAINDLLNNDDDVDFSGWSKSSFGL